MGGRAYPFPGGVASSFMAVSEDGHGTLIEVYPEGVTLVPGLAARRLPPRVRLVPPAEPVTRRVFTVSRRGGDRKPAVRVVLDALSAAAA